MKMRQSNESIVRYFERISYDLRKHTYPSLCEVICAFTKGIILRLNKEDEHFTEDKRMILERFSDITIEEVSGIPTIIEESAILQL